MAEYKNKYNDWLENDFFDESTKKELEALAGNEDEIKDRFYTELEFGTAGLRGKIGAGTNRMNRYIIMRATQGLAEVIKAHGNEAMERGVAIAYDCRHFSDVFAKTAALVLAQNGIKAYLFESLRTTPELSFTVRHLKTISGIVVTASHNPQAYNGYKVYWEEGAQILDNIALPIQDEIRKIKQFSDVKCMDEEEALAKGLLTYIGKDIDTIYLEKVKGLALRDDGIDKAIRIVYTPLNGTGNMPVRRVLRERGFTNVTVVPEQENPDPDFTTVGYPNPEDTKAFKYSIELGKKIDADVLIATDPDCDRLAVMVKDGEEYWAFNGNQTGAVLIKYILEALDEQKKIPSNGVIIKSIVTGDLGKHVAEKYGVTTVESLTGFKNICGKENKFEQTGEYQFLFGYEESIGYVYGTFVRDKDAVISSMLLAEAAAYYKTRGKSLKDVLYEVFEEVGYTTEDPFSIVLEGIEGKERINRMMVAIRENSPDEVAGKGVKEKIDFLDQDQIDVGKTNGLKFILEDDSWFAVRPSGTEPKIKVYVYTNGKDKEESDRKAVDIQNSIREILDQVE
ncbi:MAG TPA: phospho-sugar mutase [Thermotogota bacterium]|nr:phospho-sugar mutase [Thermotogota bacterium]HPJ87812.1 phospho-sugar mutase [Thermotogota bacterium]HPR95190.1 phospho-sugar mutase [Thermotogota bacterium]